ncbi:hypothetical protein [Streptomyces sp. ISL-86]|uniref:hypothetical protein n=1 Tax=Streptomyces sp. ISL-86 TaxID=2819187 RepID=UPI001BEBC0A0|nr:hypothetical protein [Streptomyces sp. ISL-86]MBT2459938.1 hypothetical protein [Streptomyces sp. ISL-86]
MRRCPPELLLSVWSWWPGSLSFPGRPRNHPRFPSEGLLRFAGDGRPRMRLLALDDPESTPALVEQFSHDPEFAVRARAAEDPRLSPGAAARLVGDGHWKVHRPARQHPNLPVAVLVSLLRDADTARDAARNPAVPVAVMHQMVSLAAPHC